MMYDHDAGQKPPKRVAEPVQVYLNLADRERLERLAARLGATKSDVLRQGLAALEAQTRQAGSPEANREPLPTFRGEGLQAGADLDDTAALLDLMDGGDAAR
jgi:hypothetical protein